MAPYRTDNLSSSDDEEEAPEAVSLVQSKRTANVQETTLKEIQAAEKERRKEHNRERDRKLKERADATRKLRKAVDLGDGGELRARMERAMQDAEEEMDGEDEDEDMSGSGDTTSDGDSESGEDDDDDDAEQDIELGETVEGDVMRSEDEDDDQINSSDSDESTLKENLTKNPQHLPDHIFASAFTPDAQHSSSRQPKDLTTSSRKARKRKNTRQNGAKDLILG